MKGWPKTRDKKAIKLLLICLTTSLHEHVSKVESFTCPLAILNLLILVSIDDFLRLVVCKALLFSQILFL